MGLKGYKFHSMLFNKTKYLPSSFPLLLWVSCAGFLRLLCLFPCCSFWCSNFCPRMSTLWMRVSYSGLRARLLRSLSGCAAYFSDEVGPYSFFTTVVLPWITLVFPCPLFHLYCSYFAIYYSGYTCHLIWIFYTCQLTWILLKIYFGIKLFAKKKKISTLFVKKKRIFSWHWEFALFC